MRILFLGDIVGPSGCNVVKQYLPNIVNKKTIDFVVANGENAAENVVRILPPLNVKKNELDLALKIIEKVCSQIK